MKNEDVAKKEETALDKKSKNVGADVSIMPTKYSKEQLIKSKKYYFKADLLNTLLSEDKEYTTKEVDEALDKALKTKV